LPTQSPRLILVNRYRRRHPKTPEAVVKRAVGHLHRLKADKNFKHVCHLQVTDEDSQVMPAPGLGFRRHACSITNVETGDVDNEVRAATTIYHESLHAKDIAENGPEKAITKAHEIRHHHTTIAFLKDWQKRDQRQDIQKWIRQEIDGEHVSIKTLRDEP